MRGECLSSRYTLKGDTTMTIQSIPVFNKEATNSEVPISELFHLVSSFMDIDDTDGPHRYYGWWDLSLETIPETIFNMIEIGSRNKDPKIIVLTVEFIHWCCSAYPYGGLDKYDTPDQEQPTFWIQTFPKIREAFIKNISKQFG